MSVSVRLGALFLSLSITTAFTLFLRSQFSPATFAESLGRWSWDDWSFDAQWLSQKQLAAFTLVYAIVGSGLVLRLPIGVLLGVSALIALGFTIADRLVARRARSDGVPNQETQALSQWRWLDSQKAHTFTRGIEEGDIHWVPSTLTVLSLPLFFSAISLCWRVLATIYPTSAWMFILASALTVGIPAILACMLGPTPEIVKQSM